MNQQQPKPFALCHGEGLEICTSCVRCLDRYETTSPYQPHLKPTVDETGRCADWKPA